MTEPQPSAHHTVSAMKIPQLSVFLENRPGSLLPPLQLLAEAGLNLAGLSLADTAQFGILRLVLRDWARARELLERGGWVVKLNDMVAIDVDHALARILAVVAPLDEDSWYGISTPCSIVASRWFAVIKRGEDTISPRPSACAAESSRSTR